MLSEQGERPFVYLKHNKIPSLFHLFLKLMILLTNNSGELRVPATTLLQNRFSLVRNKEVFPATVSSHRLAHQSAGGGPRWWRVQVQWLAWPAPSPGAGLLSTGDAPAGGGHVQVLKRPAREVCGGLAREQMTERGPQFHFPSMNTMSDFCNIVFHLLILQLSISLLMGWIKSPQKMLQSLPPGEHVQKQGLCR